MNTKDFKPLNNVEKINWFPGHMNKSWKQINLLAPKLDLIIFVQDARALKATFFQELIINFPQKVTTISLKQDLSPKNIKFSYNLLQPQSRKKIINLIEEKLADKIARFQKKGLINPIMQIAVIGLPNIGKSTLINLLAKKKICRSANIPGYTKKMQKYCFKDNLWIYDTPGIFYPRIDKEEVGYHLALIGSVKRENIPLDATMKYAYNYLKKNYKNFLFEMVNGSVEDLDFFQFLNLLIEKNGYWTLKKKPNYEKAMWYFYDCCCICKHGLISWDQ